MRRIASVFLFIIGGWLLMTEMIVAFLDVGEGVADNLIMLITLGLFALLFLVLGAWASPGQRWRELGLTMLITSGIATFSVVSAAAMLLDPAAGRYMPSVPAFRLAPAVGGINFVVLTALGWLLYRRGKQEDPAEAFR